MKEQIDNGIQKDQTKIIEPPFSYEKFLEDAGSMTKEEFFEYFIPENPNSEEIAVVEWMAEDIPFKKSE
jgi:hypothetical protein